MSSSKSAVITGITGQDGRYLAELLLAKGYSVHGFLSKKHLEAGSPALKELERMGPKLHLHPLDLENHLAVHREIQRSAPDECYHLASPSFVSYSLNDELQNFQSSFAMTHALISSIFEIAKSCRFYLAGSSEMFGSVTNFPQDESCPFRPRSLYGIAKVASYNLLRVYRDREGMFICTGFLYNHESPRRGSAFVTRKISLAVAAIKMGLQKELVLGNLDVKRDWGSAQEYVDAMWRMIQHEKPEDFVIATGQLHSVREFVDIAFKHVGLDYREYVKTDPKFYRVGENIPLVGSPVKARDLLSWQAVQSFEHIIQQMVDADLKSLQDRKS